jgi:hypothetical protein
MQRFYNSQEIRRSLKKNCLVIKDQSVKRLAREGALLVNNSSAVYCQFVLLYSVEISIFSSNGIHNGNHMC